MSRQNPWQGRWVVVVVDNRERARFFTRLAQAWAPLGVSVRFVVPRRSLVRRLRSTGCPVRCLGRSAIETSRLPSLDRTRQVVAGELDRGGAQALGASLWSTLEAEIRGPGDLVVVWNGGNVEGAVVRALATTTGASTGFLEIANLPGKLVADPQGVNAASSLFDDPSPLNAPLDAAELADFERWRTEFVARKLETHAVPQAHTRQRPSPLDFFLDCWGRVVLGAPNTGGRRPFEAPSRRKTVAQDSEGLGFDGAETLVRPYVFLPLQVAQDTQILLHSEVDNVAAIRWAGEHARERGLELVVKPHPAETDRQTLAEIVALREELGFRWVDHNTFRLIDGAEEVVTINSTVGLEARLMGKPVRFLGRTHLAHLDGDRRLAVYVSQILLDIDYFDTAPIPGSVARDLLTRWLPDD